MLLEFNRKPLLVGAEKNTVNLVYLHPYTVPRRGTHTNKGLLFHVPALASYATCQPRQKNLAWSTHSLELLSDCGVLRFAQGSSALLDVY